MKANTSIKFQKKASRNAKSSPFSQNSLSGTQPKIEKKPSIMILFRHVPERDPMRTENNRPRGDDEDAAERPCGHIPTRDRNHDRRRNEDTVKIIYRQVPARDRPRSSYHNKKTWGNENRTRGSYRHVEGVNHDRTSHHEYPGRNEGTFRQGPPQERTGQTNHSSSRPAPRDINLYTFSRQPSPREQQTPHFRQNNPFFLRHTFLPHQARAREDETFNYHQAHPRAENAHHTRQAYPRERDTSHSHQAYSREENNPWHRQAHGRAYPREWDTSRSYQAYSREENNSYQAYSREETNRWHRQAHRREMDQAHLRERNTYPSQKSNLREDEHCHSYQPYPPRRNVSHSGQGHPREQDNSRSRHGQRQGEESYSSREARPRQREDAYNRRHAYPPERHTSRYRQAHPQEEVDTQHRHNPYSRGEDTFQYRQAQPREEDNYPTPPRHAQPQEGDTAYSTPQSHHQTHQRERDTYHSHHAPPPHEQQQEHSHFPRRAHPRARNDPSHMHNNNNNNYDGDYNQKSATSAAPLPLQHAARVGELYKILNVSPDASQAKLIRAARKRRIEVHPDRRKISEMTPSELGRIDSVAQEVGLAADTLCDEQSRKKYDRALSRGLRSGF